MKKIRNLKPDEIEVWRDIKGYEGRYQVSNLGRVKSLNYNRTGVEQVMSPRHNENGYAIVILSDFGKRDYQLVHRLVAQAFIPNPNNYPVVNHKDENPSNNNVDNLEWCTVRYNNEYGTRVERASKNRKKPVRGYTPRGETVCWFASPTDAMIFLTGKKRPDISSITKAISQNTTYKNLKWEYDRIKPNTDTIS